MEFEENNKSKKNIGNKKSSKKKTVFIFIFIFAIVGVGLFMYTNSKEKNNGIYTVKEMAGFINYTEANSEDFKIKSEDFIYGPYIINITENNYIYLKLQDNNNFKNIGYIKLYVEENSDKDSFFAKWYSDNINFLCIKVFENNNENVHWYFFNENGNLIKMSENILNNIDSEEKKSEEKNKEIDKSQRETIETKTNEKESIAYLDKNTYMGYNLAVTTNKEIVLYKIDDLGKYEIFTKVEAYINPKKLSDNSYVNSYGPGYYADLQGNNIRIRVDKYIDENSTIRYEYIWYIIDGSGNIIDKTKYVDANELVYVSKKDLVEFNVGVTPNKEIVIYKKADDLGKYEIIAEVESYVNPKKLSDNSYVNSYGPGFYEDLQGNNIRIRVDKYIDENSTIRYEYIWYIFDKEGNLVNRTDYVDVNQLVYVSKKDLIEFNVGVTPNKEIVIYKKADDLGKYEIIAQVTGFVSKNKLQDNYYVNSYGPGFYEDLQGNNIRLRVDKYINEEYSNRYSYIWYIFDKTGKTLSKKEYISSDSIAYNSTKKLNDFTIGITVDKKIIVYKSENGRNEVFAKIDSYIEPKKLSDNDYVNSYGPGFYADLQGNNIRIRVDKYINKDYTNRYSYIWYTLDNNANIITTKEYL